MTLYSLSETLRLALWTVSVWFDKSMPKWLVDAAPQNMFDVDMIFDVFIDRRHG